jgi:hypothetical protein
MVDVRRVKANFFYWTPTRHHLPHRVHHGAADYERMGGHVHAMKPFEALEPVFLKK